MSTAVRRRARRDESLARIDAGIARIARIALSRQAAHLRAERSGVALSPLGAAVLAAIYRRSPVNLRAVAAAVDTQPSRVSKEVDELRRRGWVRARTDPGDARAQLLTVSATGRRAFERYRRAALDLLADVLRDWSDAELRDLAERVGRLAGSLSGGGSRRRER